MEEEALLDATGAMLVDELDLDGASATRPATAPRPRNAAATREALLVAAQDLFGRKGYERTTTREIGEAPGSTRRSSPATSGPRPTSTWRPWPRSVG